MPAPDLSSFKVAASEVSSATKFNNLVQAVQDEFGDIDPDQIPGYPADAKKFLRGDGAWAIPSAYDYGAPSDVANTVVETATYSKAIAAGDMGTARSLRLKIVGDVLYNNNVADTLRLRVKFGGVTILDWITGGPSAALAATRKLWAVDLVVGNVAAANVQIAQGKWEWSPGPGQGSITTGQGFHIVGATNAATMLMGTAAADTSLAQTLELTAQWSAASVNNSLRARSAILELV